MHLVWETNFPDEGNHFLWAVPQTFLMRKITSFGLFAKKSDPPATRRLAASESLQRVEIPVCAITASETLNLVQPQFASHSAAH